MTVEASLVTFCVSLFFTRFDWQRPIPCKPLGTYRKVIPTPHVSKVVKVMQSVASESKNIERHVCLKQNYDIFWSSKSRWSTLNWLFHAVGSWEGERRAHRNRKAMFFGTTGGDGAGLASRPEGVYRTHQGSSRIFQFFGGHGLYCGISPKQWGLAG